MTSTTGTHTSSDAVELLTRSWTIDAPRFDTLLVHGLGEHCGRWDAISAQFNAAGSNVYSYDLRGHGASGGDRIDLKEFAEFYRDISAMASATAASTGRPWVLYGHSLGGLQCAGYLIEGYEPVPNVAVLSAPAMVATRAIDGVLKGPLSALGRLTPTTRIPTMVKGDQLSRDAAVGEAYFADPLVETRATTRFARVVYGEQDRLSSRLGDILVPTLVIHGADDELVQPAASAGLAASSSVVRKLYPGMRHEMHNEPEAGQVIGDVLDWITAKLF